MKDTNSWNGAHVRLKRLYDARVPPELTQKEFGLKYGIGSQSMVAQYLTGRCPLNYDAAAKFAKGLNCTIDDISPEMAESLQEILPFLGKALRRAAMYAAVAVLPALTLYPSDSNAFSGISRQATVYYVKSRWGRLRALAGRWARLIQTSLYSITQGGIANQKCS